MNQLQTQNELLLLLQSNDICFSNNATFNALHTLIQTNMSVKLVIDYPNCGLLV